MPIELLDLAIVGVLGVAVGGAELVSRYRDAPTGVLKTAPALIYVGVNAMAAAGTLAAASVFNWNFGIDPSTNETALRWTRVFATGTASMLLLRSSLFTIRTSDTDVGIGLSSLLQVILGAADRAVDRERARARAQYVKKAMSEVSFTKAYTPLPALSIALMQNLARDDQEQISRQVKELEEADMPNAAKILLLGLALMNAVGEGVLAAAINTLDHIIRADDDIDADDPGNE